MCTFTHIFYRHIGMCRIIRFRTFPSVDFRHTHDNITRSNPYLTFGSVVKHNAIGVAWRLINMDVLSATD